MPIPTTADNRGTGGGPSQPVTVMNAGTLGGGPTGAPADPITATTLPIRGTLTDRSSSTSGTPGTSTEVMPSNANRSYLLVENVGASDIWINFGANATAGSGSLMLKPGGSFIQEDHFVSTQAVNVVSAAASVAYTAKEG